MDKNLNSIDIQYTNIPGFSREISSQDISLQTENENQFKQKISVLNEKQRGKQLKEVSFLKNQLFSDNNSLDDELKNKYNLIKKLYYNEARNYWDKNLFIKELHLSEYLVKDSDFDLNIQNDILIISSNSSYFSSLTGLNWLAEKRKSRDLNNREPYDKFDKISINFSKTNMSDHDLNQKRDELLNFCKNNDINFYDVASNWWCVIQWTSSDFVWIKKTPLVAYLESKKNISIDDSNYMEETIIHEKQHIKFDTFLKNNNISQNWYLKILNEVIAHCCNVKNPDLSVDFDRIIKSMSINENYIGISGLWKEWFIESLKTIIHETKVMLNWANDIDKLDSVMISLIYKYIDK